MVIQRRLACESKCVSSSCIGCLRNSRNTFAFAGLANAYLTSLTTPAGVPFMPLSWSHNQKRRHSRPQSLRSFWPAAGIERFWEQPFQACAIDEDFVKPDGQNSVISFVISSGCSQSSRFLPQARRIVGSGDENGAETLRTFALIVSAHPYCARKFTCHVMHRARALSTKMNNDRADGHWYSFAWI